MNQIRLLSLTLFTGLLLSAGLYWFQHQDTQVTDPDRFNVGDQSAVDHIIMKDLNDSLQLKFNGISWKVNEQFTADAEKIKILFAAVDRAIPKRKISNQQKDSVALLFQKSGVLIKFLDGEEIIKEFYAAGFEDKNETYFREDATSEIFQMTIPGYRTYLFSLFDTAPEVWRELRIFDFNWRNFSGLEVRFPKQPEEKFEVGFEDGFFSIREMPAADTTRLNNYLDAVSLLKADRFLSPQKIDSIKNITPDVVLQVKEVSGKIHELRVLPGNRGLLNERDYLELNDRKLRLLMAGRSAFKRK